MRPASFPAFRLAQAAELLAGLGPLSLLLQARGGEAFLAREKDLFFIGAQETLGRDFLKLRAMLQLSEEISLPTDPVKAHRNPGNLDYALDDEATENLRKWYRRDQEFIEFCRKFPQYGSAGA